MPSAETQHQPVGYSLQAAISRHVSQTGSAGPFHDWGAEARDQFLATEHYRLAASALPTPVDGERSLFDGLI